MALAYVFVPLDFKPRKAADEIRALYQWLIQ